MFEVELVTVELELELEIPVGEAVNEVPVIVGVIVVRTPLFSTETIGLPVIVDTAAEVADDCEVAVRKVDRAMPEDDVAVPRAQLERTRKKKKGRT